MNGRQDATFVFCDRESFRIGRSVEGWRSLRCEDPAEARQKGRGHGHRQSGCGKNRGDTSSSETGWRGWVLEWIKWL